MKLIKILFQFLIFFILILSVFILITSKTAVFGGLRSFVVVSGSMQPEIYKGSIVFSFKQPAYQPGNIISFTNIGGQVVTHRIIDKIGEPQGISYQVKGDANNTPDGDPVEEKSIIGRVFLVIPLLGSVVQLLKTPAGFIGLIIGPSALFIVWELYLIKKELEKEIEQKLLNKYKASFS
ncbi:signal peptidase I [Candidatus Gottesmanbacteria bacterium RIFCSPHIGHO2_02_FULL_39_14]|uniref:Signal peptidase I n=1 Tax=Candidatus Gottesmanbacteria bacterium RIFCSPHIGHO2_02_FULL_39_14 TaxID=1798383 RepID=A0A1F5ZWK9_9BACT|nr:MAG: signal peptidase I [Candidatus Gottesmanbacteria bacterium RIFCSPHIGHO2_02_FULL_39_14]